MIDRTKTPNPPSSPGTARLAAREGPNSAKFTKHSQEIPREGKGKGNRSKGNEMRGTERRGEERRSKERKG